MALGLGLGDHDDVDAEAEEVLNELNILTQTEAAGNVPQGESQNWCKYSGSN